MIFRHLSAISQVRPFRTKYCRSAAPAPPEMYRNQNIFTVSDIYPYCILLLSVHARKPYHSAGKNASKNACFHLLFHTIYYNKVINFARNLFIHILLPNGHGFPQKADKMWERSLYD